MIKVLFILPFALSFIISCGDGGSSGSSQSSTPKDVNIPNLTINCSTSTDCGDNTANGATSTAVWYIGSEIYAIGSTSVSCSGGTCTGTISSWVDESINSVTQLTEGAYNISIYIDTDGDSSVDNGEPLASDYVLNTVSLTDSTPTLDTTSWINITGQLIGTSTLSVLSLVFN